MSAQRYQIATECMSRRTRHRRRTQKKHARYSRRRNHQMRGGVGFTPEQEQTLRSRGITEYQLTTLRETNIPFNQITSALDATGDPELATIQLLDAHIFDGAAAPPATNQGQPTAAQDPELESIRDSFSSLATSDLATSTPRSSDGYTSGEDMTGGRSRSHHRYHRHQHRKKTRRAKRTGGTRCFGTGVGANSYDPNNSIYNTNMLKLFPYK